MEATHEMVTVLISRTRHKQTKVAAINRGLTLQEAVDQAIELWLKHGRKGKRCT